MVIINDIIQGSPEWLKLRLGVPSASNFDKIVTTKGERSKQREKYLYELAGEKITGERANTYKNEHMERGNEREEESRRAYEYINDVTVEQVGFCFYDEKREFGCSPDGFVCEYGGFETKDALPHVQIERLEKGWKGTEHFCQVQGNLYVTGKEWWDLVSYSRGIKPIIIRIYPDDTFIRNLSIELRMFINDLNKLVERYSV
jgi:hypothetical protein